jgi:hypothetical protein
MEKQLENPEKKKKAKQPSRPSSAQLGRAPATPDRWDPPVSGNSLPRTLLSLARCLVVPSCRRRFIRPRAPLLSALWARFASRRVIAPARPFSLSASWASPVSSALPAPPWTSARALARRRNPRPLRSPTRPCSFFSPARARTRTRTHTHSPASFHVAPLSLALCPRRPTSPGTPRPPPRSSSSLEATPSDPELRHEVRHPFSCSVSLITLCSRPISISPEFGRGGPPRPRGDWLIKSDSAPPRWPLRFPSLC